MPAVNSEIIMLHSQSAKLTFDSDLSLFRYSVFTDQSVLHAIRKSRRMDKLIYVSCNPSAAFVNFLE